MEQKKKQQQKKKNPKWKLLWIIKAPVHGFSKARDMYVKTMMGFAGGSHTDPRAYDSRDGRGFSTTGSKNPRDEDLMELVKAVLQAEFRGDHHQVEEEEEGRIGVLVVSKRRNASVIGRIYEEDEMEFGSEEEERK